MDHPATPDASSNPACVINCVWYDGEGQRHDLPLEQLSELESDDLVQLRERMDALRQQMQASGRVPDSPEPTEQPTENN